jgi:hypothetical protein
LARKGDGLRPGNQSMLAYAAGLRNYKIIDKIVNSKIKDITAKVSLSSTPF